MSLEADYITSSELDPESASEWCESKSDTEREDPGPAPVQRSKRPTRKQGRKSNFKAPPSISTPPSATAPPSIPRSSPSIPSQYQVPNDQDKYRDLPDYMPYMPRCVPQALPTPLFQAQTHQTTAYKMEPLMQQHRFASDHLLQGLQGAGQHGFTVNRSQGAGQFDFTTCKSFQGAGISFQSGIKRECQPGNSDLLMDYSGMGLSSWFDPSTGQFRPQYLPQPFDGHDFDFDFAAAMPFALSDSQLAMDPNPFAPSGFRDPPVDIECKSSKLKASSTANATTIPLLCILCEKTPKFSDVSHLLTHISSKGHLSRRFQLDLQAQTDQGANLRLVRFETWFEQNGIQELLKTRQEAKDQKKRTQVRRQRGIGNEKKSRSSSHIRDTLKSEPNDDLQLSASHLNPLNQQSWHQDMNFGNPYQTPSNKRTRSVYPEIDSPQDPSHHNDETVDTGKQGEIRTPILKGVIHKGMGMFDAATPEMKRIRNQRKHPSVLNKMVLVSESISMTEQVWNESMTKIEHERSVYDTPTDLSSPAFKDDDDDGEPQPKKPRGTRAASKSTGLTTERLTRSATRAMNRDSTRAARGGKRGGGKRGGAHRGRGKKVPKVEEEGFDSDELDIHHGKRGLSVFHDGVGDNESPGGDVFVGRPLGAHGFGGNSFGGHQAGFPPRNVMQGLSTNRPLSSMYGRTDNHQFGMYDKENEPNVLSMQQTSNVPGYYQPRQSMQAGAFNPLYVQRQDNFANVYGRGFDNFKPSNSVFQSLNGMGYNGMHGIMSNTMNNDLHAGFNNDMTNGLNIGLSNSGLNIGPNNDSHFRSDNNGGQNNGFDIQ